ncbi:MAG: adenylate/guanylate cyclase domain-containing protein [Acidobacteriota bacterium]
MLTAAFLLVNVAHTRNARRQIDDALEVASGVFHRLIDERARRLVEAARLLSADYAFKTAYATADRDTVLSALENHRVRIGADVMILADLDYEVVADTRRRSAAGAPLPFADRIEAFLDAGEIEGATILSLDGTRYQMVIVPLLAPMPDAWICVGFRIDDRFAQAFRRLTLSHVSLVAMDGGSWEPFASTLPAGSRGGLGAALERAPREPDRSVVLDLAGEDYLSLVTPIHGEGRGAVLAVLQRSVRATLAPYLRLRAVLLVLFLGGLTVCVLLGTLVGRSISRPVLRIAAEARRVEGGDYSGTLDLPQRDEIGELARAFNHMMRGLEERDRVRNLLGKVVSPAIARELLSKEIELGGEERIVTILFSDLRGFTAMCEGQAPRAILARLNAYLTRMTEVVERHGGVVDKYIGDAIMALFGAPLGHPDDASRAVATAMEMTAALRELDDGSGKGFRMGVGLNTGTVVAGNMGSQTRLNYTVIGDAVNLASRLEGLTKAYGAPVIVSGSTRDAAPGYLFRELDRVRVRGRREPVAIFEPVGPEANVTAALREELDRFHEALDLFRRREWEAARERLEALEVRAPRPLYRFYLDRLAAFGAAPPDDGWDGTSLPPAG